MFLSIITFSSGCTYLVQKQLAKIEDKNFTLAVFNHSHLGSNEENVYSFYKEFPIKKLMFIIAREHNLVIDISEFQKFIIDGKPSDVNVKRGFRKEHFSWNNKTSTANRIVIHYQRDYFDQKDPEIKVSLVHGSRTIDILQTELNGYDYLFKRLAGTWKTADQAIKEYDKNNYESIIPVTGLLEYTSQNKTAADNPAEINKKDEIESLIKDHIKDMDKDQKAKFRHEMLDFIYKITE